MPKKKRPLSKYNLHMKREMNKGKTFKQAVASWKKGGKSSKRRSSPSKSPRKRRRSTTTKRKRRNSRRGFSYTSIFPLLKMGALIAPGAVEFTKGYSLSDAAALALAKYTGYDFGKGNFEFSRLAEGWLPFLSVSLVTAVIPRISGFIRRMI